MLDSDNTSRNASLQKRLGATTIEFQRAVISKLFGHFAVHFPGKVTAAWRDGVDLVMEAWRNALHDLTIAEIARGAQSLPSITSGFLPSTGEFRALCEPEFNYETAFQEAAIQINKRRYGEDMWSDPVIYWAALKFGAHELTHSVYQSSSTMWRKCVDDVREQTYIEPVPANDLKALPAPELKPNPARLSEIKSALAKDRPKNIAWAYWNIARIRRGEKVASAVEQMAATAIVAVDGQEALEAAYRGELKETQQ